MQIPEASQWPNGTCEGLAGWHGGTHSRDACLNSTHWAMVNAFAQASGTRLIFGLRNSVGMPELRSFLRHCVERNYSIFGIEPSNEEGCPANTLCRAAETCGPPLRL